MTSDIEADNRRSAALVLLLLGLVGVFALVYEFFVVYFAIGEIPEPTRGQEVRYLVTAGATLLSFVGCMVLSGGRSDVIVRCGGGGLALALVVAVVFSVPMGRWWPDRVDEDPPSGGGNPNACFSGTQCDMAG